ncbi:C2H2-type domain-containing protein [Fusarium sp. LHS14.1]|nr:C2H2-type domain-containing protein [Fusarium sp. LHS14.1]
MDDPEADYELLFNNPLDELEFALMVEELLSPLNTNSDVNDAESADTQLRNQFLEETDKLNALTTGLDPQLFDFNTHLPTAHTDYTPHQTWYPDTMPTPTEYSPSATLNSSSVTDQSPGFSSVYSTSPLSTNCSPREQLLPPTLGPTTKPTPTDASPPKKKRQQRRRTKANPGNRACDKKRRDRKNNKNVQCMFCPKLVSDNRDRKRHYRAKHREEAIEMGIDMRRFPCEYCSEDFARGDHVTRHMETQHGVKRVPGTRGSRSIFT